MIILHCMKKKEWDVFKKKSTWGEQYLSRIGYIPCCTIDTLNYVKEYLHNLEDGEKYVVIMINGEILDCDIRWEEWNNSGNYYPHLLGVVNNSSVICEREL